MLGLGDPPCTADSVRPEQAVGLHQVICDLGGQEGSWHGHLNWGPVTYSGRLAWIDHEPGFPGDDEYTIALTDSGQSGLLRENNGSLHIEFKASETLDNFGSPWWKDFRGAVDYDDYVTYRRPKSEDQPNPPDPVDSAGHVLRDDSAVASGMFGIDTQHGFYSELHPVFALAINVKHTPEDDVWAIFVRNWGSEGFCSHDQMYLDLPKDSFALRLPWWPGAKDVRSTNDTSWFSNGQGTHPPTVDVLRGTGIAVTFGLAPPDSKSEIDGELHLVWRGGAVPTATTVSPEFARRRTKEGRQRNEAERRILQLLGDSKRMKRIVGERLRHAYSANPRIPGSAAFKVHEGGDSAALLSNFRGGRPPRVHWRTVVDTIGQGQRDREICQDLAEGVPKAVTDTCAKLIR